MKARFTADGFLQIERAGKFKRQECPYTGDADCPCGDWCPMLNEITATKSGHKTIVICNDVHHELAGDLREG